MNAHETDVWERGYAKGWDEGHAKGREELSDHHRALIETCTAFRAAVKSKDRDRVVIEAAVLDQLTIGEYALTGARTDKGDAK